MEEIWKDIPEFEGIYQVSNYGQIKSLGNDKSKKEKILKLRNDTHNKLFVDLYNKPVRKRYKVHQLVAIVFLNHIICGHKYVIDHIDGNSLNNNVNNLQIVTNRENSTICYRKDKETWSSQYIGVSWNKKCSKWISRIKINGKEKYLGAFINELDASNAYQNALNEL